MSCETCTLQGFNYTFSQDHLSFGKATDACRAKSGNIANVSLQLTPAIASCCSTNEGYWVNPTVHNTNASCLTLRPPSQTFQSVSCETKQKYICASPSQQALLPIFGIGGNTAAPVTTPKPISPTSLTTTSSVQDNLVSSSVGGTIACLVLLGAFSTFCYWLGKRRTEQRFAQVGIKRSNLYKNNTSSLREIEERVEANYPGRQDHHYCYVDHNLRETSTLKYVDMTINSSNTKTSPTDSGNLSQSAPKDGPSSSEKNVTDKGSTEEDGEAYVDMENGNAVTPDTGPTEENKIDEDSIEYETFSGPG